MKSLYLKHGCVIAFFLCGIVSQKCEAQLKTYSDCSSLYSQYYYKGDTVLVDCDSIIVVNIPTFQLYSRAYSKVLRSNELISTYDTLVKTQAKMIKERDVYIDSLRFSFNTLVDASTGFLNRSDQKMTSMSSSLQSAEGNINNSLQLLKESRDLLQDERKKLRKRGVTIAAGGFAVGIGVASLIYLIVK